MAGGEVVGDGIVLVGVVGHPDEGDHVAIVEEVEDFDAEGEVVEEAAHLGVANLLEAGELDRVAPVDTEIGGQGVADGTVFLVGEGDGGAGAEKEAEAHAPPGEGGDIVLEEDFEVEPLVGGAGDPAQGLGFA